jgi:hypothetical protein
MDNIKILTWNICWEIMKNSTIARNNILNTINKLIFNKYDFIALQEASYIYTYLDKYDYIITTNNGKFNKENENLNTLITLYDKTKYRVKKYYAETFRQGKPHGKW